MDDDNKKMFDGYASSYSRVVGDYVGFAGQPHSFYTRAKAYQLLNILETRQPGAQRVLDVGCGHGLIHPLLKSPNLELHGVDVAPKTLDQASRANPDVNYEVYDGTRLPYQDNHFDSVFTICVMHHVLPDNWPSFVAEMHRVLRPGGTLTVFEHNRFNPVVRYIVSRIPIDSDAVLLSSGKVRNLLRRCRFTNLSTRHFLFFPFDYPIVRRAERSLRWFPMGAQYVVFGDKA
jgi:ubiquinone/menaquinone biosynthesis C-methylase UbiE